MQEFTDQMPADIKRYAMVPIRDVVIFPFTKVAFKIGRPSSVAALEEAMSGERDIFLATQHDATVDEPAADQIHSVGTIGRILQAQRQDNGQIKVVVEGRERGQSVRIEQDDDGVFHAHVRKVISSEESGYRTDGLLQKIHTLVEQLLRVSPDAYTDALHASLRGISAAQIADSMSSHLRINVDEKQVLLETASVPERLQKLIDVLEAEIEKRQLDRAIHARTKKQMDKHQREYYLNEQIKAIHKELGRKDEKAELEELKKKIDEVGMTVEAKDKAHQELSRLEAMPPMSAESTVSRTYIDWLVNVPWKQRSEEYNDLREAEDTLNEDHYGLEKIKERILEFLAVRQLVKNPKGTILCFVGPPGVGKTSLGKSIANATGRKFVRLALGGVHDEAEIRGHRRTYIGALPGQIVQLMKRAGTINPVILLDEVDKLGRDFRGDPSSALLEVLDPEQNHTFRDHYLDVDYDLSNVFFIATANVLHTIPPPLQDRLEVLNLSGYTEREKVEIAKRHLISKQCEHTGIDDSLVKFTEDGVLELIRHYTREAGVRNLEREIGSCLRKIARKYVATDDKANFNFFFNDTATTEIYTLSLHDLGLRNLVIITGDPPKMGDFPDATPVYDLDSIGILKLATRLNHGIDPGGKPLGATTSFVLATGAEPAALNYPRELDRLAQKKAAGAELVMTQPVYDPAVLVKFLDDIAPLGLPVLVGLLPLASYRNAEFLHNEVPGMQVPEHVRERMRKAGTGAAGRKEGVAIAREMLAAVHERVAGAYVMPPLEKYELALEVVDGFAGRAIAPAPRLRAAAH